MHALKNFSMTLAHEERSRSSSTPFDKYIWQKSVSDLIFIRFVVVVIYYTQTQFPELLSDFESLI